MILGDEGKVKVDDPVGAIAVHGVHGILGVLCVGLFANGQYGAGWNLTADGDAATASGVTGVFYDASLGLKQLGAKAIGWADKRRRYGVGDGSSFDGSETIDLAMHRTKAQRRTAATARTATALPRTSGAIQ